MSSEETTNHKRKGDETMTTTNSTKVRIRLGHQSSIQGAIWCEPVGWTPANEIEGADWCEGAWLDDESSVAGLVWFHDGVPHDEDDVLAVELDDLRVASCGDCRVIGEVEVADPGPATPY